MEKFWLYLWVLCRACLSRQVAHDRINSARYRLLKIYWFYPLKTAGYYIFFQISTFALQRGAVDAAQGAVRARGPGESVGRPRRLPSTARQGTVEEGGMIEDWLFGVTVALR